MSVLTWFGILLIYGMAGALVLFFMWNISVLFSVLARAALRKFVVRRLRNNFRKNVEEIFALFGEPANFGTLASGNKLVILSKEDFLERIFELPRYAKISVFRSNTQVYPWGESFARALEGYELVRKAYEKYRDEDSSAEDRSNSKYSDWIENLVLVYD